MCQKSIKCSHSGSGNCRQQLLGRSFCFEWHQQIKTTNRARIKVPFLCWLVDVPSKHQLAHSCDNTVLSVRKHLPHCSILMLLSQSPSAQGRQLVCWGEGQGVGNRSLPRHRQSNSSSVTYPTSASIYKEMPHCFNTFHCAASNDVHLMNSVSLSFSSLFSALAPYLACVMLLNQRNGDAFMF